jgi:hypothetical protein
MKLQTHVPHAGERRGAEKATVLPAGRRTPRKTVQAPADRVRGFPGEPQPNGDPPLLTLWGDTE